MFHGRDGLLGVGGVELLDVFSKALQFLLAEFVTPGRTKEGGKRPLKDCVIGYISGNFASLKSSFIHERQFFRASEPKEIRQPLQKSDIARRRIHTAFDLAPIAGIKAVLRAEVA